MLRHACISCLTSVFHDIDYKTAVYYNVTLWLVRLTIVAVETIMRCVCVFELHVSQIISVSQQCANGKFISPPTKQLIRNSFWKELCSKQFVLVSHGTCKGCTETKECSFARGLLQTHSLAEHIVMTDKSLRTCCKCCGETFHEIRRKWISYEAISIKYYGCVCVSILLLVIRHAKRIFSAPCYIVVCGLYGSTTFFHIIS